MRAPRDLLLLFADLPALSEWRDEMLRPRVRDPSESIDNGLAWWMCGNGPRRSVGHPGGDPGYVAHVRWYPRPATA